MEYYDDGAFYSNHQGYFLYVYYIDGHYELDCRTIGMDILAEGTQESEENIRAQLAGLGIQVPESAEMTGDGEGNYTFTVPAVHTGENMVTGTLECKVQEGVVTEVNNDLLTLTPYKDAPILSPEAAYEKLKKGEFGGNYWLTTDPKSIVVTGWTISYQSDTKGFYQPVYLFRLTLDGGVEVDDAMVPALK